MSEFQIIRNMLTRANSAGVLKEVVWTFSQDWDGTPERIVSSANYALSEWDA
jgi:hypothetical protein